MTIILQPYYTTSMAIKQLPGQRLRVERAREFWMRVATDLNAGMTPAKIAQRYINPNTGKHYTREHIYWVINVLRKMPVDSL